VELLVGADGIDVNLQDNNGRSPLNIAAFRGHEKCVELLVGADGIDINHQNKAGYSPLYAAASLGKEKCVELLLGADGIDVNPQAKDGRSALHIAASHGQEKCVELLLGADGIEVNLQAKDGISPLDASVVGAVRSTLPHKSMACFHRILGSPLCAHTAKVAARAKLTAWARTTATPAPLQSVAYLKACATLDKHMAGTSAWCAHCFESPPTGAALKICSGCKAVGYCSEAHAKLDWKQRHKQDCKVLAAQQLEKQGSGGATGGSSKTTDQKKTKKKKNAKKKR
jgi:hypothetical protein